MQCKALLHLTEILTDDEDQWHPALWKEYKKVCARTFERRITQLSKQNTNRSINTKEWWLHSKKYKVIFFCLFLRVRHFMDMESNV